MLSFRASLALLLAAGVISVPALAARTHKHTTSKSAHSAHHATKTSAHSKHRSRKAKRIRGQQQIDSLRVTEIQQALIREHYLTGEATGDWDASTKAAMQKYQSDQGWQTKLIPDSRALKKLGLGPDYSDAINAKGSSFNGPVPASSGESSEQTAGFAAASGVNQ